MDKQIIDLIEKGNRAFDSFKSDINNRLETIEAKRNRPGFGSGGDTTTNKGTFDSRELMGDRKAFDAFVRTGDDSEMKSLAVTTNGGADGGYAVPKVIDGLLETLLIKQSPLRQLANVVQVSTQDYHKLVNIRGEAATWAGETDARPATNTPKLADIVPTMGELYANALATQRMLDDVFFNAEQWLADTLADQFSAAEGSSFLTGDGTNKPTGLINGTINNQADGTRAFGAIQYIASGAAGAFKSSDAADCLVDAVQSMRPGYRTTGEAAWLMSPGTLAAMMKLKDSLGRPLIMPAYASGERNMLLGYPVYEDAWMPDIAANSYSIAFGNFRRAYTIVDRIGMKVLRDPFSAKPYVGFYATKRTGGALVNSEAVKLVKFAAS